MSHGSRQATVNAGIAGLAAALVLWLAPPGSDFAAHAYQLQVFADHGFALWTNYWYAGRYAFVGYSVLYYPLAAALGIKLLAVLSAAGATAAFTLLVRDAWGDDTVWATRLFAVTAAASVLTAAFPYGLGLALGLMALVALARGRRVWFGLFMVLTLAASPLAFAFLIVVLCALAASSPRHRSLLPVIVTAGTCAAALLVARLFPDSGRFPFATGELLAALTFCSIGAALSWRVERARVLRALFAAYAIACLLAYAIPSAVGENIARMRLAAIPLAVLTLSLRRWRPLPVAVIALGLAVSWNVTPLAWSLARGRGDPSSSAAYWQPVVGFLHRSLTPDYRVEAVDTAGHWEAVYLSRADIPIVRGWFRQDDFPQNELLYDGPGRASYLRWLHRLGVRYVVLTDAPQDYSARAEAALLRSGRSGLRPVFRTAHATIYAVPDPAPIVTGPAGSTRSRARVVRLTTTTITIALPARGSYRLALRYSPYLAATGACISRTPGGFTELHARRPGVLRLAFRVTPERALAALVGRKSSCGAGS